MNIFKPDYQNHQGVRPINIYVLRIYFALMFFMMGQTAWAEDMGKGIWKVFFRNVCLGFFDENNIRDKQVSIRLSQNMV